MASRYGRTIQTNDPNAGETEDDEEILRQWCVHTLQTRKGTLETDPEHGFDLPALGAALTDAQRVSIPAAAQAALERGRKVARARVEIDWTALGGGRLALSLKIEVWPAKGGPSVSFTHAVDEELGGVFTGAA